MHVKVQDILFTLILYDEIQYPAGTSEISSSISENLGSGGLGAVTTGAQVGYKRNAFLGSCKHHVWQAIRASSAAPYYLDDYSDGTYFHSCSAAHHFFFCSIFSYSLCFHLTLLSYFLQVYTAGKMVLLSLIILLFLQYEKHSFYGQMHGLIA